MPEHLAWLEGYWEGCKGENCHEEYLGLCAGGAMMSVFRWMEGPKVRFYGFLAVESENDPVHMRIKHFYPV